MRPYKNETGRLSEPAFRNVTMSVSSGGSGSTSMGGGAADVMQHYADALPSSTSSQESSSLSVKRIKCVVVGDAGVGKTSLIVSYTTNGYPQEYVPTAFDNYSVLVRVDNQPVQLQLCDTAGQADFDHLRPLCYPNADIFIVCFSVVCPTSFYNLQQRWVPEIKQHSTLTPVLLVGTQSDQRTNISTVLNLSRYGETVITEAEAKEYAEEIKALQYVECSALTQHNLKEVFDAVILASMKLSPADASGGNGKTPTKILLQHFGGRKSFKKLKEKLSRSNSVDSTKHSSLQIRRQLSNQRLNHVGLMSPDKQQKLTAQKAFSNHTRSAPASGFYGSSVALSLKVTPEKKQTSPGKHKKGWRRLLCMA